MGQIYATQGWITFLLVIHEYGHAWVMRRLGMRVDKVVIGAGPLLFATAQEEIRLLPFIGMAISDDYAKASVRDRAIVAAAALRELLPGLRRPVIAETGA